MATAAKHGAEFCQARALKAGLSCKAKYGSDYYSHISAMRKRCGPKKGFSLRRGLKLSPLAIPLISQLQTPNK